MSDIIGKRFRFFLISGIVLLIGIVSLASFGLKAGIEFSAGSLLTLDFENEVTVDQVKQEMDTLGHSGATVQITGDGNIVLRTVEMTTAEKTQLEDDLAATLGPLTELSFDEVDPMVAHQTARTAAIAVAVAAVGILIYITWAFRRMPRPFRYGACAVIALVHDALVVLGVFSILGWLLDWEVNLMFITGILAVIGYSVNNTVVVFDRIRENQLRSSGASFESIVNNSLAETLTRSLNTSLTTVIVVLALLLFVGSTIQNFSAVLLIGILSGTFSSLFIAPSLLVVWERGEWGRFLRWLPLARNRNG